MRLKQLASVQRDKHCVSRYFAISARGMWAVLVAGRGRWPNKLSRVVADGRPTNWLMTADICFKRQQQQLRDTTATTWSECVAKRKIDEKLLAKNAESRRGREVEREKERKREKEEELRQQREANNLWHFYAWLILILETSIYPIDHRTIEYTHIHSLSLTHTHTHTLIVYVVHTQTETEIEAKTKLKFAIRSNYAKNQSKNNKKKWERERDSKRGKEKENDSIKEFHYAERERARENKCKVVKEREESKQNVCPRSSSSYKECSI